MSFIVSIRNYIRSSFWEFYMVCVFRWDGFFFRVFWSIRYDFMSFFIDFFLSLYFGGDGFFGFVIFI